LRAVLDGVTDGIVVLGRDGRCRYLNESAAALLGRVPAKMLGRQIWGELPEELRLGLRRACEAAAASGRADRLVQRHATLGGWFELRVLPHDRGLVIVFRDVTDEQLAHDELVERP
jgi:PAS domain S-box-containing protein